MSRIDEAFARVPRVDFVPSRYKNLASVDTALPIGFDQTISQPTTVRIMLEWLDVRPGHRVLDVGSGSGWTTALLSLLVGDEGKVYAVEKIPELMEYGRENCGKLSINNVEFHLAGDELGYPEQAPYDRILVSAESKDIPESLLAQLKRGGIMVLPVGYDLCRVIKRKDDSVDMEKYPGFNFIFVPLV
jgi:protein-L-isoaspartate(D-aspartate) O-methyltransferase